MPCTGCDNPEYVGRIKARYIGHPGDKGGRTFVYGRVYEMPARFANKKAYPLFELVALMPEAVIPEKYAYIEKRVEVPAERIPVPVEEAETVSEPDEPVETEEATEPIETEFPELDEEDAVIAVGEYTSSIRDSAVGLTQSDVVAGMDVEALRVYIEAQTGKEPDGRWGLKRLIEEAKKLQ